MKKLLLLLPMLLLFVGTMVQAADPLPLPTNPPHTIPPFVYHLDPPAADFSIPANTGPAVAVSQIFTDGVLQPPYPWHWETEWRNTNAFPIILPLIFRAPGVVVAGILTLPPGTTAVIEIVFNEVPETGTWKYSMRPMIFNPAFDHDVGVCEDPPPGPIPDYPPEFEERPLEEIEASDHIEVGLGVLTPTVSTWGMIALALLLLAAATLIIRRRRVEA